jgi:Protein of unknown function (DUF3046)
LCAGALNISRVPRNDTLAERFPVSPRRPDSTLVGVRLTAFWERMNTQFGDVYAQSVAKDFVFANLGGRTIERALADGEDVKKVWRAVCETFNVPESLR